MQRRTFLCSVAAGSVVPPLAGGVAAALETGSVKARLAQSPQKPAPKVKTALVFLGKPGAHWPTPELDPAAERKLYLAELQKFEREIADIEFTSTELVAEEKELQRLMPTLREAYGIAVVQLTMWTGGLLGKILSLKKPTVLYAAPYSGHEWTGYGRLLSETPHLIDVALSSDKAELVRLLRPLKAAHFLEHARVLNVTSRKVPSEFEKAISEKLGTTFIRVGRDLVLRAYEAISSKEAEKEADLWIKGAEKVVEPKRPEIVASARLALAFEKLLKDMDAAAIGVDCYGSMYHRLPAFPCVGFVRLNNMGLAGICESDMSSAVTFLLFRGLVGRPGFISDPTIDTSKNAAILAHCLGTPKMDGPDGPAAPYRLRTIMERREGVVPQVRMRVGQKVTQARIVSPTEIICFTGRIVDTPDLPRGCRTKITVEVDGSVEKLWRNWKHGLHRVTCYGDIVKDLKRFCRLKGMELTMETEAAAETG